MDQEHPVQAPEQGKPAWGLLPHKPTEGIHDLGNVRWHASEIVQNANNIDVKYSEMKEDKQHP